MTLWANPNSAAWVPKATGVAASQSNPPTSTAANPGPKGWVSAMKATWSPPAKKNSCREESRWLTSV